MNTLITMIDFGVFIMIWLVQLVVYPAFQYFNPSNLERWHHRYTKGITIVVMPLMISQLFLHGYILYQDKSPLEVVTLALVLAAWYITFVHAVPLHNKISMRTDIEDSIKSLIQFNLGRALIWTVVLAITFFVNI
ncbi:MAG: hypothetical protein NXI20_13555 [bacterium]|nr:hypothetical protein [bacterium]